MAKRGTKWVLGLALALAFTPAWAAQKISIATGGTGGVYYPYGGGMAEIINEYVPNTEAVAEVTGASVENVRLVDKGESAIGLVMGDVAYQAYNGVGKFESGKKNIAALFVMYPNQFHVVTLKDSGINTISDIKGKTISVGAPGSGTAVMGEAVLAAMGLGKGDYKPVFLSFNETAAALKDGTIDVGLWSVAPPTSSIMDLATARSIRILPFSDEDIARIRKQHPYYSRYEIPAGVYTGVDAPVPNPSVWNVAIVNREMPEAEAYQIAKAIFDHQPDLLKIHKAAQHTLPANAVKNAPIPLHPGVVKYLKERGIEVPADLIAK